MIDEKQKNIIYSMFSNHSTTEVAKCAGLKNSQVTYYAHKMGLSKSQKYLENSGGRFKNGCQGPRQIPFSSKEKNQLAALYADHTAKEISLILGKAPHIIYRMAKVMNLEKSESFKKSEKSGRILNGQKGSTTRFTKGQVSWNKGKKLGPTKSTTTFKKGNVPHNTKHDGHERISKDGYVEVRVKVGKYALKHRVVWEQNNGPVPRGMVVIFKDGNKLNTAIENLELVSRQELMSKNTIHRYPEELKSTIRLIGKVKRTINTHEKQD